MQLDLITRRVEGGKSTAWQDNYQSHHGLQRVSWHELLNVHCEELLPQLLLINLTVGRA